MPDSHSSHLYSLQWSPNGKYLAAATPTQVTLWDADQQRPLFQAREAWGAPLWSPDSRLLLTGGHTAMGSTFPITVRSLSGEILAGHGQGAATWSPDGTLIALSPTPDELLFCDPLSGEVARRIPLTHWISVTNIAWSPCSQWIATAAGNEVHLTALASGTRRVLTHDAYVCSLSWSPDSQLLTAGIDEECRAATWQVSSAEVLFYCDHRDEGGATAPWVHTALWSPDGGCFVTGPGNNGGRLWSPSGEFIHSLDLPDVQAYAWHPSGDRLAALSSTRVATLPTADPQARAILFPVD